MSQLTASRPADPRRNARRGSSDASEAGYALAMTTDAPAYRLRDIPRAAWLHVVYHDSHGEFHAELWACSFTEAEQRLADIGATRWEIGR